MDDCSERTSEPKHCILPSDAYNRTIINIDQYIPALHHFHLQSQEPQGASLHGPLLWNQRNTLGNNSII